MEDDTLRHIQKQIFDVQRSVSESVEKFLQRFLAEQNMSIDDFVKGYVFEWRSTHLEDAISGTVLDLDMRSDTTTVKFVTYYRIRRKTDRDRAVKGNGEETDGE